MRFLAALGMTGSALGMTGSALGMTGSALGMTDSALGMTRLRWNDSALGNRVLVHFNGIDVGCPAGA